MIETNWVSRHGFLNVTSKESFFVTLLLAAPWIVLDVAVTSTVIFSELTAGSSDVLYYTRKSLLVAGFVLTTGASPLASLVTVAV